MQIVAIGKPLFEARRELPEAVEYNYQSGDHTLLLSMKNLHPNEIRAVRSEEAEFGLYCENSIVFLLYRFGETLPWSDSAFSWWNVAEEDRRIPEQRKHPAERILLKISSPSAWIHVIAPSPKMVGISQFQRPMTAKPASATKAAPINPHFKPFKIQKPFILPFMVFFLFRCPNSRGPVVRAGIGRRRTCASAKCFPFLLSARRFP